MRRDGCTPYIDHPASVAKWLFRKPDDFIATSWLHDVLEDTVATIETFQEYGVDQHIIDAVILLSKNLSGMDTMDYLNRIKANGIARQVKIADMICNLADNPTEDQIKKYIKRLKFLIE